MPSTAPQPTPASQRGTVAPSENAVAAVVSGIGPRLRALRAEHGLSLQQLADRSGVSPAAIHKVEQAAMVPTITTLLKLAAAFQVPVGYFIDEDDEVPAFFTPAKERRKEASPAGDLVVGTISAASGPFEIGAAVLEIAPGADRADDLGGSAGEALVHVVTGTLELRVGDQSYRMTAGDSLHFRAEQALTWHNPSTRVTAKVVWASLPRRR